MGGMSDHVRMLSSHFTLHSMSHSPTLPFSFHEAPTLNPCPVEGWPFSTSALLTCPIPCPCRPYLTSVLPPPTLRLKPWASLVPAALARLTHA